jgi:hypothetical protein
MQGHTICGSTLHGDHKPVGYGGGHIRIFEEVVVCESRVLPCRTPVYMAPELIHSRDGSHGYDGKQVDVWASGILLIVMLLGTFPYDHIQHTDPNSPEAHEEVW